MRKEHPSDADLVRRFRAGEARAFEALVDRYKRPLFVLLARLVGDRDAADDLLQESFVRLWRHMDTLDVSEPLFGLLRRTAVNLGLNHMRGRARRRDAMDSLGRELSCAPAAAGGTGGDDASDETSLAVREALDEIPAEQRTCLVLRVQEEMSYAEIARSTGVAVGTVMSRLSRARASLREKLKQRAVL